MEALIHLEEVQGVLDVLQSHCIAGTDVELDRFLAEFLLREVKPSQDLQQVRRRIQFLEVQLPKLSMTLLEEVASHLQTSVHTSSRDMIESGYEDSPAQKNAAFGGNDSGPTGNVLVANEPLIGLSSMLRARSTLEDFCRSYFMFHGLDVNAPPDLFRHLPILMFVESYIYQLDEQNEEDVHQWSEGRQQVAAFGAGKDPFKELQACLARRGLLTRRIQERLKDGVEYWLLEQSLCRDLVTGSKISIHDVMRAIRLKSFDYQVLNLLLYRLQGEEVNEDHYAYLCASEFLVEIADDLYDYEEDVLKNSFNLLRMLVSLYGPAETPKVLAKCISEAEATYEAQLKKLEPSLSSRCQLRCEEAVREGGGGGEHPLGSWTIPHLILDEPAFRLQVQQLHEAEKQGV